MADTHDSVEIGNGARGPAARSLLSIAVSSVAGLGSLASLGALAPTFRFLLLSGESMGILITITVTVLSRLFQLLVVSALEEWSGLLVGIEAGNFTLTEGSFLTTRLRACAPRTCNPISNHIRTLGDNLDRRVGALLSLLNTASTLFGIVLTGINTFLSRRATQSQASFLLGDVDTVTSQALLSRTAIHTLA